MMLDIDAIKVGVVGKWRGILSNLGIEVSEDPLKHTACPICGPGNNSHRFRFDDKDGIGSWICTQCGAGDGWSLVQRTLGLTFIESINRITEIIGSVEPELKDNKPKADPRERLNKLWKSATPISAVDMASQYLMSRGLMLSPKYVRFCKECYEPGTKTTMPAMLAMVVNSEGKPVTIHRTYLAGPKKADIESPKKHMPSTEKLCNVAVRLFPATDVIGVAEGIETAIACMQLFEIPTWSCINSTLLESFEPPKEIRKVVIFGDCDSNFAGQKAAYRLANKLYAKDLIVDVQIPASGDWADEVLRLKTAA
jgi:putative DNA primase/helicase